MYMTEISFNSEYLKVDYLSLNLRFNNLEQIKEITSFLAKNFGCRSNLYNQSSKTRHLLVETISIRYPYPYSAEFVINLNKHWAGTTIGLKGQNAPLF